MSFTLFFCSEKQNESILTSLVRCDTTGKSFCLTYHYWIDCRCLACLCNDKCIRHEYHVEADA